MQMSGLQLMLKCWKIAGAVMGEINKVVACTGIIAYEVVVADSASILQCKVRFAGVAGCDPDSIHTARSELIKAAFVGRVGS